MIDVYRSEGLHVTALDVVISRGDASSYVIDMTARATRVD